MLQDMSDRYSYTLAMIGLVKTLLALDTQKQTVGASDHEASLESMSRINMLIIVVEGE